MTIYTCENCNKEFNRKSTYDTHLQRKNPCKIDIHVNNQCSYCNKLYSTKYNLNVHLKSCKELSNQFENKSQIEELKKMFEKKIEELEKKVELSNTSETNNNITTVNENSHNNINSNNNITNNINIYSVGKEDLSLLSNEDIVKICTSGTYYPIIAAQILHCNEKYPEFQNCLIPNLRSNTGLVKINDNWVSKSHEEIFRTILKVDKSHVSTLMKDLDVDTKLQLKLESTQDEIDTNENKEHQIPKIKEHLYNASRMIGKNKKKDAKLIK